VRLKLERSGVIASLGEANVLATLAHGLARAKESHGSA
jgi:hypothetical protein